MPPTVRQGVLHLFEKSVLWPLLLGTAGFLASVICDGIERSGRIGATAGDGGGLAKVYQHATIVLAATGRTVGISILAFGVAALAGAALFGAIVVIPWSERVVLPVLTLLRATPVIVFAPLVYRALDVNLPLTYLTLGAMVALFPITTIPIARMKMVPAAFLDVAAAHGASKKEQRFYIRGPWAVAGWLDGLRTGASLAVIGVVVTEMIYVKEGYCGSIFMTGLQTYSSSIILAALFALGTVAYLWSTVVDVGARWCERRYYGQSEREGD